MLDRLPPELLSEILRLASPGPSRSERSWSRTYGERRLLLRKCCLVSSRMRAVAQKLLPEVLEILLCDGGKGFVPSPEVGARVRVLRLDGLSTSRRESKSGMQGLREVLKACPNVRDLMLFSLTLVWQDLAVLPRLRSLSVQSSNFDSSPPAPFPHLAKLTLLRTLLPACHLENLLTPTTLPALRQVRLENITRYGGDSDTTRLSLSHKRLPRLDVLVFPFFAQDDPINKRHRMFTTTHSLPILHHLPLSIPLFHLDNLPSCFHLYITADDVQLTRPASGWDREAANLEALLEVISALSSLRILVLPPALHPPYPSNYRQAVVEAVDKVFGLCAARGVEILVGKEEGEWVKEVVPRSFRLKMQREAEQAVGRAQELY